MTMQGFDDPDMSRAPSLMAGFRPMGPLDPGVRMGGPYSLMTGPCSRMGGPSSLMTGPSSRMQGFRLPKGLLLRERRWHLLVDLAVAAAFIAIAVLGSWSS